MEAYQEITLYGYRSPDSILIVRNDKLGDLVLAIPLIRAVKAAFPETKLGLLVSDYAAPLLEKDPDVDLLFTTGQKDLSQKLRTEKFDTALVLWGTRKNAWTVFKAGVKRRYGINGRWFSFLFNRRLSLRRSQGTRSEAEYNLDYLRAMAAPVLEKAPRLTLEKKDEAHAASWLKKNLPAGKGPVVMMHPGSGGSAQNWDSQRYAALGNELVRRYKARLVLTGGPAEQALLEETSAQLHSQAAVLKQSLPLRAFAALLARADLFVSASTGPMHLAAAGGASTLSLFPPVRAMSPLRWGPRGNRHAVLTPPGLGFGLQAGRVNWTNLITVKQAAEAVGCAVSTIYRWKSEAVFSHALRKADAENLQEITRRLTAATVKASSRPWATPRQPLRPSQ